MKLKWAQALSKEVFWFALIALFVILSIFPLHGIILDDPYLKGNMILALLFAFYFRVVIFFREIPYLKPLALQVILFLAHIPLFVIVMGKIQEMIYLFDTSDLSIFFIPGTGITPNDLLSKFQFFRSEFLLFSVGLLILIVLTEFRIILAFVQRIKKIE